MPASTLPPTDPQPPDLLLLAACLRQQRALEDELLTTRLTARQRALIGRMRHLRLGAWSAANLSADSSRQPPVKVATKKQQRQAIAARIQYLAGQLLV